MRRNESNLSRNFDFMCKYEILSSSLKVHLLSGSPTTHDSARTGVTFSLVGKLNA